MTAAPLNIPLGMLPKQIDFLKATERYLGYFGSRAGGKTYAGCVWSASRASYPGTREGLFRQNYTDLVNTTLLTLLEGDDLPPVLPPGTYTHNEQKHRIDLHGGGTILYGGLDKGVSAREMGGTGKGSSMNLTGALFDEGVQVPQAIFSQFDGSVRLKHPAVKNQLAIVCNPGPPNHWIAREWGLALGHTCLPNHFGVRTNIFDNFMLDPETVRALAARLTGVAYKRYILGLWVGSDGLVFDRFNRDVHVQERDFEPVEIGYGMDVGINNPSVVLCVQWDKDGRAHISNEFYERGRRPSELIEIAGDFARPAGEITVDNAEKGLILDMQEAGIDAVPSVKGADSVRRGLRYVDSLLAPGADGDPMLTIDPSCVNTIAEFESYEYKPNTSGDGYKDEPKKENDHAIDALRYHVDRQVRTGRSYISDAIEMSVQGRKVISEEALDEISEAGIDWDEARRDSSFGWDQDPYGRYQR